MLCARQLLQQLPLVRVHVRVLAHFDRGQHVRLVARDEQPYLLESRVHLQVGHVEAGERAARSARACIRSRPRGRAAAARTLLRRSPLPNELQKRLLASSSAWTSLPVDTLVFVPALELPLFDGRSIDSNELLLTERTRRTTRRSANAGDRRSYYLVSTCWKSAATGDARRATATRLQTCRRESVARHSCGAF